MNILDGRYVSKEGLLDYMQNQVYASFPESTGYSLRTLQRDFKTLRESFGIDVRYKEGYGYHIAENLPDTEGYMALLQSFEILNSIYSDSVMQKYVVPEHRRVKVNVDLTDIFVSLKDGRHLKFDYHNVRCGDHVSQKEVQPYFLKESQHRWYLVGVDVMDGVMKCFAVDRMSLSEALAQKFDRDESVDAKTMFRESFGIWNDPDDPVEEVILHYDSLDGAFVKTFPLHETQQILSDDPRTGLTVRLDLKITNDFVMELLSRSRSLEVLAPMHLRERVKKVFDAASERNK